MRSRAAFIGNLALNTVIAFIATTIITAELPYRKADSSVFGPEALASVLVAALLGVVMQQLRKRDASTVWVWVCPAGWFLVGLLLRNTAFQAVPPGNRPVIWYYAFAVPMIRCISFSLGAFATRTLYARRTSAQ
jgi:uncharacterized membrane protein